VAILAVLTAIGGVAFALRSNPASEQAAANDSQGASQDADELEEDDAAADEPVEADPVDYGDDPVLDALWRLCDDDDWTSCERLAERAPAGSEYERFGLTCGGRGSAGGDCVERFDEPEEDAEPDQETAVEGDEAPPESDLVTTDVNTDEIAGLVSSFETCISGVNSGNYVSAWNILSPAAKGRTSLDEFQSGNATSTISRFQILAADPVGTGVVQVVAKFRSRQAPSAGPDGESCTDWELRYTMAFIDGRWRIDSAQGASGDGHQAC
jgi:hypothetical protein